MSSQLSYKIEEKTYTLSKADLTNAMCNSNECLSPKFNAQLELLIELLVASENSISLEDLTEDYLKENLPEANKKMIENAVKSYHEYANNMYYI